MDIYDREPERALRIIDSAEVVGNVSDFRAELLRARVYAYPGDAMNLDTARQMGVALLEHDSVKGSVDNRMEVLRLLTDVARIHLDYPEQVKWASELATLCREQGDERLRVGEHGSGMTEALRTESEIGIVLTHLGQRNEGFRMLDKVIGQLESSLLRGDKRGWGSNSSLLRGDKLAHGGDTIGINLTQALVVDNQQGVNVFLHLFHTFQCLHDFLVALEKERDGNNTHR